MQLVMFQILRPIFDVSVCSIELLYQHLVQEDTDLLVVGRRDQCVDGGGLCVPLFASTPVEIPPRSDVGSGGIRF